MCGRVYGRFWRVFFYYIAVALPVLLPAYGRTPLWSQSSEPLSRSSDKHLMTWEALSGKFTLGLEQHEQTLRELGQRLQTSEASLRQLTLLYEMLLRQNDLLKTYNAQIAERMQERDEDLATSYAANERKNKIILGLAIAVVLLGIPYLVKLALRIVGKLP